MVRYSYLYFSLWQWSTKVACFSVESGDLRQEGDLRHSSLGHIQLFCMEARKLQWRQFFSAPLLNLCMSYICICQLKLGDGSTKILGPIWRNMLKKGGSSCFAVWPNTGAVMWMTSANMKNIPTHWKNVTSTWHHFYYIYPRDDINY